MTKKPWSGGALLLTATLLASFTVRAENWLGADQGKLLLTAGFSTIEGTGGGALTPWALIAGYGSSNSWGANAYASGLLLRDFEVQSYGIAVGALDRIEFSASQQQIDVTDTTLEGLSLSQNVFGFKARLFGDAVYGQRSWLPQVAVGVQVKQHEGIDGGARAGLQGLTRVSQLGALDEDGTDYYVSATKLFLAQGLLLNTTLRYTRGNQFGLLGFGGELDRDHSVHFEASVAYLIRRQLAVGVEFRDRPANLRADEEDNAFDAFIAWAPTRNISLVAAYVNVGSVLAPVTASTDDQDGAYLSLQVGF